jgi:hypothetical protein
MPYRTRAERVAEARARSDAEHARRQAEESARWASGRAAADALTAAGYPAKALLDSVILDADAALRLLAAARQEVQ